MAEGSRINFVRRDILPRSWMSPTLRIIRLVHWQREEPSREIVRFAETLKRYRPDRHGLSRLMTQRSQVHILPRDT